MALEITAKFLDSQISTWPGQKPLVFGISGPQGSGKSYLATHLLSHLKEKHPKLKCVGISIDDFYLTHAEQANVSANARESGNHVLVGRGLPGTHDLPLAFETLDKLVSGKPTKIPRYDKSAFNGEGDRLPEAEWDCVEERVDVVIFEGWFVGFGSIDASVFPSVYLSSNPSGIVQQCALHHLEEINADLKEYEKLWAYIDFSVILKTDDLDNVYRWRLEQEADLIKRAGSGMSEAGVASFVRRYMPMYELYYWRACNVGVSEKGTNLRIEIDYSRKVTGQSTT